MVKTSTQMKNMIEDWIKITGAKYQDSTSVVKSKNAKVEWQFLIGQALHVTKMSNRDDRVHIHYGLGFPDEIKTKINLKDKINFELDNEINAFLITLELSPHWVMNNNLLVGIDINTYIDEQELDRPRFFKAWDKTLGAANHVVKIIALRLQIQPTNIPMSTDTSSKMMYG